MTGGQIAAATLAEYGVDTIFTVSGNQILPIFDAAADHGIRLIHMRHETAAVYAAIGAAEVTGGPGIALVSAGPGFLAALQGVGVAASMELPILFLSGSAPTSQRETGAFQDLDQRSIAGAVCKVSLEPTTGRDVRPLLARALETAASGIPGPAHVALPADVLLATSDADPQDPTVIDVVPGLSDRDVAVLDEIASQLAIAERPVVIARPAATRGKTGVSLHRLCDRLGIAPLITESPRGLSDPKYLDIVPYLAKSDCALLVAPSDFAVGFLAPSVVAASGYVAVIDAPGDPDPTRAVDTRLTAKQQPALEFLAEHVHRVRPVPRDWSAIWRQSPPPSAAVDDSQAVHPLQVSAAVRARLEPDDVVVLDGGEFCQWIRLGLRDVPNRVLWNGKLGAIGGSIPMALGVASSSPRGRVIAVLGDGAAGYHLSELETATRCGTQLAVIVGNDARWGAEWHMQADRYGDDRTYQTSLTLARYDIAAGGFGGTGVLALDTVGLNNALDAALVARGVTCINVPIRSIRSPAIVVH